MDKKSEIMNMTTLSCIEIRCFMYSQCKKCRHSDKNCSCEYRQTYLPLSIDMTQPILKDVGRALHYQKLIEALSAKKSSSSVLPLQFEHPIHRPSQTLRYGT